MSKSGALENLEKSILHIRNQMTIPLEIVGYVDAYWGSSQMNFRQSIHNHLNLQNSKNLFSSISHCNSYGGYILSSKKIGFDIETTERVSESVIQRISKAHEISLAPSYAALWTAKEASFKALADANSIKTVSQIEIGHWRLLSQNNTDLWQFRVEKPTHLTCELNIGFSWTYLSHSWTIFFF